MKIKAKYLSISEAANHCQVKVNVLRYWEKKFPDLKPVKRNKRRYYQQKEIDLILTIKELLMVRKFTLKGAKKIIENQSLNLIHSNKVIANSSQNQADLNVSKDLKKEQLKQEIIHQLQDLIEDLKT